MTTTIELSERQAAELQQFTATDDPTAAINVAISEYIRYAKRRKLIALSNQIEMENNWQDLEDAELGSSRPSDR